MQDHYHKINVYNLHPKEEVKMMGFAFPLEKIENNWDVEGYCETKKGKTTKNDQDLGKKQLKTIYKAKRITFCFKILSLAELNYLDEHQ